MSMQFYGHPFSSYCQKVLIALYEHAIPFEWRVLADDAQIQAEFSALWPIRRFPLLLGDGRPIMESSIIIEYLDTRHAGSTRLLPADADAALEVRFMDRFFDNYVMSPQQRVVFNALRPADRRDAFGVDEARAQLDTSYRWLEQALRDRQWAAGDAFSLADCAAAPALFYADWTHPIDRAFPTVRGYRQRLLERPSFARAVDEARPYRPLFPLGAPDRD